MFYNSFQECTRCNQGYYLQSANTCANVTPIQFCSIYDETASISFCIKCIDGYYSNLGVACMVRIKSVLIAKCLLTNDQGDTCLQCDVGFSVTSDGLLCLANQPNCLEHFLTNTNIFSTKLDCMVCSPGYYLDQT